MLEIEILRDERARVVAGLKKRAATQKYDALVNAAIANDDKRKKVQTELDQLLAENNRISKSIGELYRQGKQAEADELKREVGAQKEKVRVLEEELRDAKQRIEEALLEIPNVPHQLVPAGTSESDNQIIRKGSPPLPSLADDAKPHWELAEIYGIFDLKMGARITGSGFPVFTGPGAVLQRALVNFFLDEARHAGYREIAPPLMVNEDSARATGQLPDKEGQMYCVEKDNLYLIPTSEVPLTNIYRDVILEERELPVKLTAFSPCFRREAGSYGAHVKGLNRVHQFDKVELVRIAHPSNSYAVLDEMCDHVSALLDKLELPYRVVRLCGGDLGFTSAMTYDFEVFSGAQERWLEVSSVSNFETFQSNRLNLKIRDSSNTKFLAHTLNGSALALPRVIAALLENYQTSDGIPVPKVLEKYTGFDRIEKL